MPRISPTARGRSRSSRRRSTAWLPRATVWRCAPTSSNGCRGCLLTKLKLTPYFAAICGQDTFGVMKPHPEILRQTILRAGGEPADAIMIGDSGTDVRTARAAQVPVIAVDFGYSEVPIATLQPDRIISSYGELPTAIAGVVAERP